MEKFKKILIDLENNVDIQSIINQRKIECEEENKIEEKGDVEKRLEELPEQEVGIGTLNLLKGKNLAACVERALLSQNLFKIIGIDATLKQSSITINEKEEAHAYNIIRVNGQNYIYDASLPSNKENGEKDVIVGTINDEEYMLIIDGLETGCKTNKMENGIIYDSSFGTLEEELKKYSKEEIQQLRNQAKLDEKANVISEIKQKMDKLKEIKQQVVEQELHQMQEEK